MIRFLISRLAGLAPVIFVVTAVVFALTRLIPGDAATVIAGDFATQEEIEAIRGQMGLDRPVPVQYLLWLGRLAQGDLGTSALTDQPVATLILQRIEPTLSLTLCTLLIALPLALGLGVLSAWRAGERLDHALMSLAVVSFSIPVFVLGFCLMYLFSLRLNLLPVQGFAGIREGVGAFAATMALPAATLAIAYTALLARVTRTSLIEVMGEDFNRAARARGLGDGEVLLRHALPNAAIPILTIIGISAASLLSGSVVVENMFNLPGLGRLLIDAVAKRDYSVIQGVVLLFSFIYIAVNLATDILYALADPRVRY